MGIYVVLHIMTKQHIRFDRPIQCLLVLESRKLSVARQRRNLVQPLTNIDLLRGPERPPFFFPYHTNFKTFSSPDG